MDSTVSVLQPGHTLDGRYEIKKVIAKGGMATVYLAHDSVLGHDIALKVMFPHLLDDKKFVHRFIQEAENASILNDPHVVRTYHQGRTGPFMYLAMEYIDGYTLRDILYQENHLTPRQTLEALEPILSGVAAAHRAKILHRDLKPENVLIAEDGRIKIADFGLAKVMDNKTVTGAMLGTVAYMAPELINEYEPTAASDVYSLGCMAYEMLTGKQPHTGDSPMQIAYAQVNDRVPAPSTEAPGLSPDIDEFVLHCTDPSPDKRPPDAAVMLAEVERLLRIMPADALDYDYSTGSTKTDDTKKLPMVSGEIKYRPTTDFVPPTRHEETELIPDFIKEHNASLITKRVASAIDYSQPTPHFDSPVPPAPYEAPTTHVPTTTPMTAVNPVAEPYSTDGAYTTDGFDTDQLRGVQPKFLQTPEEHEAQTHLQQNVTAENLSPAQKYKHNKHVKKADKQSLKQTKKDYKVQLRPGNAGLRTLLGVGTVAGLTASAGYAGWYFSEGPPSATQVPDVTNFQVTEGKEKLQSAGFKPEIIEQNSVAPQGTIMKTEPDHTDTATRNSTVQVFVAK